MTGKEPVEEWERVRRVLENFCQSHTKAELLALSVERGFLITPVATIHDVVESPQLCAREYFREIAHPEQGRKFLYPGPFVRFGGAPIRYRRRPPRIGEHNREIYAGELGMSDAKLDELARAGVV